MRSRLWCGRPSRAGTEPSGSARPSLGRGGSRMSSTGSWRRRGGGSTENLWKNGREPSIFRIPDAEDPWDSRARAHPESGIRPAGWIPSQPPSAPMAGSAGGSRRRPHGSRDRGLRCEYDHGARPGRHRRPPRRSRAVRGARGIGRAATSSRPGEGLPGGQFPRRPPPSRPRHATAADLAPAVPLVPWTIRPEGLKAGAYEFRVRTADSNGFAQPEPRLNSQSGHAEVPCIPLMVT
jgi:hypothetical protein